MWNTKFCCVFLLCLWIIIPDTSGTCEQHETCQRCISNLMCTFVKDRNNNFVCAEKKELFQLQPKAVYKTPRRCNVVNKKKAAMEKDNTENPHKAAKGGLKHAEDKIAIPAETWHFQDILSENMKLTTTSSPFTLKPTSVTTPTTKEINHQTSTEPNTNHQSLDEGGTQEMNFESDTQSTTEAPVAKKVAVEIESAPFRDGTLLISTPPYTNTTENAGVLLIEKIEEPSVGTEIPMPVYPWTTDGRKYEILKEEIVETCCKLEKLFREFGDLHFLTYKDIQNYNFVSFQIRNPVISRWYLCNK